VVLLLWLLLLAFVAMATPYLHDNSGVSQIRSWVQVYGPGGINMTERERGNATENKSMRHLTTFGFSKGPKLIIEKKWSFGDGTKHQEI